MSVALKPLYDHIVVERSTADEKTSGGIVLPDTAREKPRQGRVLAVGSGKMLHDGQLKPLEVHEGDHVLFGSSAGTEVKLDGKEYLILKENDVLAVLNN